MLSNISLINEQVISWSLIIFIITTMIYEYDNQHVQQQQQQQLQTNKQINNDN